ncbi:MAG: hypothetical protein IJ705_04460 [Oscillospiraceae bacterium]|nr:hypothetical protein [Oscillospiraceae bacterium]
MAYVPEMKKLEILKSDKPLQTQADWEKQVQFEVRTITKVMRKNHHLNDGILLYDLTEGMLKRRSRALRNTVPAILERYASLPVSEMRYAARWCEMNLPLTSYSLKEAECDYLFAASIWILDQITAEKGWRALFRLLPRDERDIDEICSPEAWVAEYEESLISSVAYVLRHRNPITCDGEGNEQVLTNEALAAKSTGGAKQRDAAGAEGRKKYEALIAMIPRERIDRAVRRFREQFWLWVDRFFAQIQPFIDAEEAAKEQFRELQHAYNGIVEQINAELHKVDALRAARSKARTVLARPNPIDLSALSSQRSGLAAEVSRKIGPLDDLERIWHKLEALDAQRVQLQDDLDGALEERRKAEEHCTICCMRLARSGRLLREDAENFEGVDFTPLEPMEIEDPYELCFALLYLIEADDVLPWLYGAGCGLMAEVGESLPWGILDYDELEDPIWMPEDDAGDASPSRDAQLPKSVRLPDWYARKYWYKDWDPDHPRSLAQILYEATGCILPRSLDLYNGQARDLMKLGVRGKDAAALLMLMSTVGSARRSITAANFEGEFASGLYGDPEAERQTAPAGSPEEVDALKAEVKRLKSALHSSEQENRETKKALASLKSSAERERRELADLRDIVFRRESDLPEPAEERAEEQIEYPYETRKRTVVFGGHDTFLKAIKPMLPTVRFVDSGNLAFNAEIVRNADVVWIQNNCISHPMYWKVVKNCKVFDVQLRYFGFASAEKCAKQLVLEDRKA